MTIGRSDEARNTKPVRIPSLPPPTGAQPVARRQHGKHDRDEKAGGASAPPPRGS